MPQVLAAADIGSNTAHLLIAETNGKRLKRMTNESVWLSLGEVVSNQGYVPEPLASTLLFTLGDFQHQARAAKAEGLYVFATEAMRVATNHDRILKRIKQELAIDVDLISGRRETELSFRGTTLDCDGQFPAALIEVGGGSVQVARAELYGVGEGISVPLGTGRLIDQAKLTYPCDAGSLQRLREIVDEGAIRVRAFEGVERVVGSGGVLRGIWRALHPDGGKVLAVEELDYIAWAAARLSVPEIVSRFGVKAKRATTLVPGAVVYATLLRALRVDTISVSEFGVREGAILEMAEGRIGVKTA